MYDILFFLKNAFLLLLLLYCLTSFRFPKGADVDVALKAIRSEDDVELSREINLLRKLEHPHVLRSFGVARKEIEGEGTLLMVTEYMDKGCLLTLLHENFDLKVTDLIAM